MNVTGDLKQTIKFEEFICSAGLDGIHTEPLIPTLSVLNFLLSFTAFLGNTLILVALRKEISLHPPIVTLKRAYVMLVDFWITSTVAATSFLQNHLITLWYSYIGIPLCLVTSLVAYIKNFLVLRHHQAQVQDHIHQEQQSQTSRLNIARYKKAVFSTLWMQLTLVTCYLPYNIVAALISNSNLNSSEYLVWLFTITLLYLNSTLNLFLYCWKIRDVRQAVKETIREAVCCSSS